MERRKNGFDQGTMKGASDDGSWSSKIPIEQNDTGTMFLEKMKSVTLFPNKKWHVNSSRCIFYLHEEHDEDRFIDR